MFKESKKFCEIEGPKKVFNCTRTKIDGFQIYNFFANSGDLINLANVPRRMPSGGDLSQAYQRALKPAKVNQIGTYLSDKGAFFPNSVIIAVEEECEFYCDAEGEVSDIGKVELPNKYGSLFIIDGQHRLFGTEGSGSEKPLSVCLLEGMGSSRQANMFTSINQTQSKVPPDLLWDLYGELGSLDPPPNSENKSEVDQAIRYLISKIWRDINQSEGHPLSGKIVIPSQTSKSKDCWISFGNTLCKYLFIRKKQVWEPGYLRQEKWKKSLNFSKFRVSYFYKSLLENLEEEVSKDKSKNWLLSNYSMIVITQIFTHMVSLYGGLPSTRPKWKKRDTCKILIDDFTKILSKALKSSEYGFYSEARDIRKAGSASVRTDYLKSLVRYIRENGGSKYSELAPNIGSEEEDEGDTPTQKTREKCRSIEDGFRSLIYDTMKAEYGEEWFENIPQDVQKNINMKVRYSNALGMIYEKPYDENILDETSTGELLQIIDFKRNRNIFRKRLPTTPDHFKQNFKNFLVLRNQIAHHKPYPSSEFRNACLASVDILLMWLKQIEENPS